MTGCCRVLALVTDGFGSRGGIGRYNCDVMRALSLSPRVGSVVALPRFGGLAQRLPAKVEQAGPEPGKARWIARAGALALRGRFDIIFCGHLNAAALAAGLARVTGARLWMQVHGIEAWMPRGRFDRRAIETAQLVTAVSRFTRAKLLGWAGIDPERVRVLPNTFNDGFAPRSRREDLVERHGLAGRRVLLTVGRLDAAERYKGHDRVIGVLGRIAGRLPDVSYLVVGGGRDRIRLDALAREKGVAERVVFAGEVAEDELADYFALGDVYAMPSSGEGFGIVFLEAAASGLAIVGGNRDGSVDALAEGRIGGLVDPDDALALEVALVAALEGARGTAGAGREEARRFAFPNFSRHVDDLVGLVMASDLDGEGRSSRSGAG